MVCALHPLQKPKRKKIILLKNDGVGDDDDIGSRTLKPIPIEEFQACKQIFKKNAGPPMAQCPHPTSKTIIGAQTTDTHT